MNGYSKIRQVCIPKSRSVDFSDLSYPIQAPNAIWSDNSKNQEMAQNQSIRETATHVLFPEQEVQEDGAGEIFGVILSRAYSVSSASSQVSRAENHKRNSAIGSAVSRALSMRISSPSVSEGYSRIHHQCDPLADDEYPKATRARRTTKKRGKILQACRRLFGF